MNENLYFEYEIVTLNYDKSSAKTTTITAARMFIEPSGALVFLDEEDEIMLAIAPGYWVMASEVVKDA